MSTTVKTLSGTVKPASYYITNNYYNNGEANKTTYVLPRGVAVGLNGVVYSFDKNTNVIRQTDINGITSKFCGNDTLNGAIWANGFADGNKDTALFSNLTAICTDNSGNVYVIDNGKLRKIDINGNCTTITGLAFLNAEGICHRNGFVYVADKNNSRVARVSGFGISDVAIGFSNLSALFVDANDIIYTCDGQVVKKIINGVITVVASGFGKLSGITMDLLGNLLVTDSLNHQIMKIAPNGTITPFAGSGYQGARDGAVGPTRFHASFSGLTGIAIRPNGNVVTADTNNNKIREVTL